MVAWNSRAYNGQQCERDKEKKRKSSGPIFINWNSHIVVWRVFARLFEIMDFKRSNFKADPGLNRSNNACANVWIHLHFKNISAEPTYLFKSMLGFASLGSALLDLNRFVAIGDYNRQKQTHCQRLFHLDHLLKLILFYDLNGLL